MFWRIRVKIAWNWLPFDRSETFRRDDVDDGRRFWEIARARLRQTEGR